MRCCLLSLMRCCVVYALVVMTLKGRCALREVFGCKKNNAKKKSSRMSVMF